MADIVAKRARLMDHWEAALGGARSTGYWKDVEACSGLIEEFQNYVRVVWLAGKFSGDVTRALKYWEDVDRAELAYRRTAESEARSAAPPFDPLAWWNVLGVAPDAAPEDVRAAYADKMRQCDPDRVVGMAPEIVALADEISARFMKAFEESQRSRREE